MENIETSIKNNDKRTLYIVVIIIALASLAYRLILVADYGQSALMFVGLPTFITLLVIKYSGTPKSVYGITFKAITFFLLVSSIVLGEGTLCIIMAAPLFYGVAAFMIFAVQLIKGKDKSKLNSFIILPLFLVISQIHQIHQEPPVETVSFATTLNDNYSLDALNSSPDFLEDIPSFFKIGFPKPIAIEGTGLAVGDFRKIQFESSTKGIGTLHFQITKSTETEVVFKVITDDTHISHWLSWKEITVELLPGNNNKTEIVWTSKYTCDLNPAWYFRPIERYAVRKSAEHLVNSYFNL